MGLREFQVDSAEQARMLINRGLEERIMALMLQNDYSSRSHTVLTLTLRRRLVAQTRRGSK
jgi:hypothetical protein